MFLSQYGWSASITKADGYPAFDAEAWSEQAYPHFVKTYGMVQYLPEVSRVSLPGG